MSLSINQNITSLNAWRNLNQTDKAMSGSMERLSTGLRINKASDDPAGLVISEQMRAQVSGLKAAIKNSEKGVTMIQTAEAALDKVNSLLVKMRGLALDSANTATTDDTMLAANQAEIDNILQSITRIAENTQYSSKRLLDGSNTAAVATLGSVNNAGVSRVADSDLAAGTTGSLTVTVSDYTASNRILNDSTVLGTATTGTGFDAQATAAGSLSRGDHTLAVTGTMDSITYAAGTSGLTTHTIDNTSAAQYYDGNFTGTLKIENTGAAVNLATTDGVFNLYENDVLVGLASWDNANDKWTLTYTDGSQAATIQLVDGNVTGSFASGAVTPTYFTLAVTASTAQATLDGGPALAFNRSSTFANQDLTSGTDNQIARFDFTEANFINGTAMTTKTFQVQKAGDAMARLGEGGKEVVYANSTGIALSDNAGTVTLDFGTIPTAGGATTLDVADNSLVFQVGANRNQTVSIEVRDVASNKLAVGVSNTSGFADLSEINVTTSEKATDSLALIDAAIDEISRTRADLGAFQANTLEANLDSLRVAAENLQASESVIRDTDMAAEMADFTKNQIMLQAGTAMLAQANQIPQTLLQLLR
ncbi:MAG: flagellin N-terminal helical domain-containing protein [Deferrisomatales bacterium]